MKSFPKKCSCCGRVHDAAAWNVLPFPAGGSNWTQFEDEDGGLFELQMRNCTCNSTLAIEVYVHDSARMAEARKVARALPEDDLESRLRLSLLAVAV